MTIYTLEIAGSERDRTKVVTKWTTDTTKIHTWEGTLSDKDESVAAGDTVNIKRDGTIIFTGVLETIGSEISEDGVYKLVGGRHVAVKLWRKWIERYADDKGFWTDYYPNKIVQFFLHPSRSDPPKLKEDTRLLIGRGINPKDWTVTASSEVTNYEPELVTDRLYHFGWRSSTSGQNGEWLKIDLGDTYSVCGIRIEARYHDNTKWNGPGYLRGYTIQTSPDDIAYTTRATKTFNKAKNIVESWNVVSCRYIKINATRTAAGFDAFIGEVFIYESSGEISGISEGTLEEHLPLNCSLLTTNVSAGATVIPVEDGWKFEYGHEVLLGDDNHEEVNEVLSVDGNNVTLKDSITYSYTTGADAWLADLEVSPEINLDYMRRTEAIDKIVKLCTDNSHVEWEWWVSNSGTVYMGEKQGTDKSGSISFSYGLNLVRSIKKEDIRQRVDVIKLLGRGKGHEQDLNSSDWIGSGDYELVETDSTIESPEAARVKAEALKQKASDRELKIKATVDDGYSTGSWGIGDNVTLTDSNTGLSGSYRVVGITRTYDMSGERVIIEADAREYSEAEWHRRLLQKLREVAQQGEYVEDGIVFSERVSTPGFVLFYEAEKMALDNNTTVEPDSSASNYNYIFRNSDYTGIVFKGPGAKLKAGSYRAAFLSKVSDNSSEDFLLLLDVYSKTKGSSFGTTFIYPNSYNASNMWEVKIVDFELDQEYDDIEFRAINFVSYITDWYCDWVGVVFAGITEISDMNTDYPPGAPSVPTGLTAEARPMGVLLEWDANTEFDFDHYEIYKNFVNNSATATLVAETDSNYFFYDADASEYGTTLYFWIKAVDWNGNVSGFSSDDSATPERTAPIDLNVEVRPWVSNIGMTYDYDTPDYDHIYWGEGSTVSNNHAANSNATITFADGTTMTINKGNQDFGVGATTTYWFFWRRGYTALQKTTNYANAVGVGRGLVAVVQMYTDKAPTILPYNSYQPTISGGVIAAYTITSVNISTDWLVGKSLKTTGYDAGAGVAISDSGIIIKGENQITIKKADGTLLGYIDGTVYSGIDVMQFTAGVSGKGVVMVAGGTYILIPYAGDIRLGGGDLRPETDKSVTLGTDSYRFLYKIPKYVSKPSITSAYYDTLIAVRLTSGNKTYIYACVQNDANTWEWVQVAIST